MSGVQSRGEISDDRRVRPLLLTIVAAVSLGLAGCNCGPGGGNTGGGSGNNGGGSGSVGGGDGGTGAGNGSGGSSGTGGGGNFNPDASCAAVKANGTLGKKPVDIIFVIDNSGSMTAEIVGVQENINTNFAQIIGASGLDYRVIMLSKHGLATNGQSICISQPLSGNLTCNPPTANPVNGPRFFHYSTEISSTDSLSKINSTYTVPDPSGQAAMGWRQWLRDDAYKIFIEITDDQSQITAAAFETGLFNLTPKHFGDAGTRNYVFHSIVGVIGKANPADPYLSTEPLVTGKCLLPDGGAGGAVNNGPQYQALSQLTGGLRFPICDPSKYNTVFQKVAEGVVNGAQVACDFQIPPPPTGFSLSNKIVVLYTPGSGGAQQSFIQVSNLSTCMNASSFYVSNGRVFFCPATCTAVKADTKAKVELLFTCEGMIN
jgi:hypothetical protein